MLSGFETFIARGNVIDLAVGAAMGAAFGLVVSGLVESFINPLIAWLVSKPNFDSARLQSCHRCLVMGRRRLNTARFSSPSSISSSSRSPFTSSSDLLRKYSSHCINQPRNQICP